MSGYFVDPSGAEEVAGQGDPEWSLRVVRVGHRSTFVRQGLPASAVAQRSSTTIRIGRRAGVDPDHCHRSVGGVINEVMNPTARHHRRRPVRSSRTVTPLDNAGRDPVDDADRLVKIVDSEPGSRPPGMEQPITAAHRDAGHERLVEEVDERRVRTSLGTRGRLESVDPLGPPGGPASSPSGIGRRGRRCRPPSFWPASLAGEGDVEEQGARMLDEVADQVRRAGAGSPRYRAIRGRYSRPSTTAEGIRPLRQRDRLGEFDGCDS